MVRKLALRSVGDYSVVASNTPLVSGPMRGFDLVLYIASQQQGDLRLLGSLSGQVAGGGARTRDRRDPADLRVDSPIRRGQSLRSPSNEQSSYRSVGGTMASASALKSAGTLLSQVRAPPTAPWTDGRSESLRSPCCGLAKNKNHTSNFTRY
ncbi:hypothetical protein PoB_002618100 [Plakobranchus ocellatus]|uniref:Uncharacterized protein n=1 Tax=Plakobranchus ocellatus TaxID=259542 RepID=A0AAV3ZUQ7_9GAST|nr:hypothetical protein PoB_002618100 [Plakobranchus ocellatus]